MTFESIVMHSFEAMQMIAMAIMLQFESRFSEIAGLISPHSACSAVEDNSSSYSLLHTMFLECRAVDACLSDLLTDYGKNCDTFSRGYTHGRNGGVANLSPDLRK